MKLVNNGNKGLFQIQNVFKVLLIAGIMLITRTVTKKILETIVHETFSNFGVLSSSSLLDYTSEEKLPGVKSEIVALKQ